MKVAIAEGQTAQVNGQTLVYDAEGIALKLNARNMQNLRTVELTYGSTKDTDVMGRRFVASYDNMRKMFKFSITGGPAVEVEQAVMFQETTA